MAVKIQIRRDQAVDWTVADPVLAEGEFGVELDTHQLKIGDGSTSWTSLDYFETYGPFDIRAFGAIDGAANNTVPIANAVTLAAAANTGVIFPRGVWNTNMIFAALDDTLDIILESGAQVNLRAGQNTRLLYVAALVPETGVLTIKGGVFDGTGNTLAVGGLVHVDDVRRVEIDTEVNNSGLDGVFVSKASAGYVRCNGIEFGGHGINTPDCNFLRLRGQLTDLDKSGILTNALTRDCIGMTVESGTVITRPGRTGTEAGIGVYFGSSSAGGEFCTRDSSMNGVKVFDAGWVGIFPGGDNNRIVDCEVNGAGLVTSGNGIGFWIHDESNVSVVGCTARRCATYGFSSHKARAATFVGCTAENNGFAGFRNFYDTTATPRRHTAYTNRGSVWDACIANGNSTASVGTYPGFIVDGGVDLIFGFNQAHDYADVLAVTNVDTATDQLTITPKETLTFTADAATDRIFTSAPAMMSTGQPVRFSTSGGLPGGLTANTVTYYVIVITGGSSSSPTAIFKLATSAANALAGTAIDLTTAGTGTHTLSTVWEVGDRFRVRTTATMPAGLGTTIVTDHYAIIVDRVTIKAASSFANAGTGTAIDITTAGSGTIEVTKQTQIRGFATATNVNTSGIVLVCNNWKDNLSTVGHTYTAAYVSQAFGNVTAGTEILTLPTGSALWIGANSLTRLASTDAFLASGKLIATTGIGVGNSAAATTPGAVTKKMEVFDAAGASLGFVAIYDAIT